MCIRDRIRNTSINKDIEYTYLNYDLEDAKKKYDSVYTEISEIQEELNIVNSSAEYLSLIHILLSQMITLYLSQMQFFWEEHLCIML